MSKPTFAADRYEKMPYRRCGRSGLLLPAISLGGWHNFTKREPAFAMVKCAFNLGVTHFDFADNYGPPGGRAETVMGKLLHDEFKGYRDELVISTKAGHNMWPGPYGTFGGRKHMIASLDASLKRLKLDYVDIFYSHRPDPQTPLEETMAALDSLVKQGKALHVGVSNYSGDLTRHAAELLRGMGSPLLIHQPNYSMLKRQIENDLLPVVEEVGVGVIPFSPLAQGLLTDKYLDGIPEDSRAAKPTGFLRREQVTDAVIAKVRKLKPIAEERGQTIAQLAISWILRDPRITSVLIGASRPEQIADCCAAGSAEPLDASQLERIEQALAD